MKYYEVVRMELTKLTCVIEIFEDEAPTTPEEFETLIELANERGFKEEAQGTTAPIVHEVDQYGNPLREVYRR